MNFFETNCKESSRKEKQFGICDDQDGTKAYTDTADNTKWIAKVTNTNEINISFTPIDYCIIMYKEETKEKESSCDGMLTFAQSLYLVELKEKGAGGWISEAKRQLENTIKLISENHDISNFRYKKAFACNRKHPNFTVIDTAERKSFFERTKGFRIDVQAEIVIK